MAEITNANQPLAEHEQHRDEAWVRKERAFELWFGFLLISPSYELATRHRANELTDAERAILPADFDAVLKVFDDLGPVRGKRFDEWWSGSGVRNFGHAIQRPAVSVIGRLESTAAEGHFADIAARFCEGNWRMQGEQQTLAIAVPVGLPKNVLMREIKAIIEQAKAEDVPLVLPEPRYPLARQRMDNKSLFRYLQLAFMETPRIGKWKQPLWFVGFNAGFSDTYTKLLKAAPPGKKKHAPDQVERLKVLTSRGLSRAYLIAENAARGRFPTYEAFPTAVSRKAYPMSNVIAEEKRWRQLYDWFAIRNKQEKSVG